MHIRKTRIEELDTVMEIYAYARKFMAETGNPNQWRNNKPPRERVEQDIIEGTHYVCEENGEIVAVFFYDTKPDPTYTVIYDGEWPNDKPYGGGHRIASNGKVKGAGSFCLQWAFAQCGNLRIDTHEDNKVMQHVLAKNGFQYCCGIYLENGEPRIAFQKEK